MHCDSRQRLIKQPTARLDNNEQDKEILCCEGQKGAKARLGQVEMRG